MYSMATSSYGYRPIWNRLPLNCPQQSPKTETWLTIKQCHYWAAQWTQIYVSGKKIYLTKRCKKSNILSKHLLLNLLAQWFSLYTTPIYPRLFIFGSLPTVIYLGLLSLIIYTILEDLYPGSINLGIKQKSISLGALAMFLINCFFTDSALWAGSVIESPCPCVCLSVCAIGCSFFGEVFFTS